MSEIGPVPQPQPAVLAAPAQDSGSGPAAPPAQDRPTQVAAAVQILAEAPRLRDELARRFDAWLELARAPEGRGSVGHRERTLAALEGAEALRGELTRSLARAEELLIEAVRIGTGTGEAHGLLAEYYEGLLFRLGCGAGDAAVEHWRVLAEHHRRVLGDVPGGDARLQLESEPPGCGVWLTAPGIRGWAWGGSVSLPAPAAVKPATQADGGSAEPGTATEAAGVPGAYLGLTSTPVLALPPGRYQAIIRREAFADACIPVRVERAGATVVRVRLRTRSEVGEGFVPVPAGPFLRGNPHRTAIAETGAFAMGLFPVTFGAYCEYLDAIGEWDEEEAESRVPRTPRGEALCARDSEDAEYEPCGGERGSLPRNAPAVGVSWQHAAAYAAWKAARDVVQYRLPTRLEWEKAARGIDGEAYPWGNRFDASFCVHRGSAERASGPQPVGKCAHDVSPYGVRDLAGNVLEWCSDGPPEEPGLRYACGGAWNRDESAALTYGANRFNVDYREEGLGFRLVHALP